MGIDTHQDNDEFEVSAVFFSPVLGAFAYRGIYVSTKEKAMLANGNHSATAVIVRADRKGLEERLLRGMCLHHPAVQRGGDAGQAQVAQRTLPEPGAPIATERWAGAVDPSAVSRWRTYWRKQSIAAWSRLAAGLKALTSRQRSCLFILRNVSLAGIDSINAPQEARIEAWSRLPRDLDLGKLARTTQAAGNRLSAARRVPCARRQERSFGLRRNSIAHHRKTRSLRLARKERERLGHEVGMELEHRAVSGIGIDDELAVRKALRQIVRVLAWDHAITVAVRNENGVVNL